MEAIIKTIQPDRISNTGHVCLTKDKMFTPFNILSPSIVISILSAIEVEYFAWAAYVHTLMHMKTDCPATVS